NSGQEPQQKFAHNRSCIRHLLALNAASLDKPLHTLLFRWRGNGNGFGAKRVQPGAERTPEWVTWIPQAGPELVAHFPQDAGGKNLFVLLDKIANCLRVALP